MNVGRFFPELSVEKKIVDEITQWTSDVLEKPSPFFNNLPACPYAKQALMDEKVAIIFKYEKHFQTLYSTISQFEDVFDLAIIVDLNNDKDPHNFHTYLDDINTAISEGMFIDKDIWVMGFHPDDEPSDFEEEVDFEPVTDTEYAMIFVQRLSKLQVAADKLNKRGYYNSYGSDYNVSDTYNRRQTLYRRLTNGNETS